MPTLKQKKALDNMVENGGNVSRAMKDAGYSSNTAKNPSKLTKSKGCRKILSELGLTDSLVINSLVDDIKSKPQKRLGELNLASDILGLKKNNFSIAEQNNESVYFKEGELKAEQVRIIEEYLKAKLAGRTSVLIDISK